MKLVLTVHSEDVPLVECAYLGLTRTLDDSYCRGFGSLLCASDVLRMLINFLC